MVGEGRVREKSIGKDSFGENTRCLGLSSQKNGPRKPGFELGTFQFQTQRSTTELTCLILRLTLAFSTTTKTKTTNATTASLSLKVEDIKEVS